MMKTVVLQEPGRFELDERPPPDAPREGDALVQVERIGVCGTDLHAFGGRQPFFDYPRILGHELGVRVLETGRHAVGVQPGDLCAVEPYLNCGLCIPCRRGRTNCCSQLKVLGVHIDGGMRERIVVPAVKLHPAKKLRLEQLALVETLGIGAHAVDRAGLEQGENVLVVGAGPIGLSVVQFAQIAGANLAVLDVNERRLAFCSEQFGIRHTLAAGEDALSAVLGAFGGELPTAVFDATGNRASMEQAFAFVASSGRLVLVGLVQDEIRLDDPEFHRRELTLLATRNSTAADFRRIIQLMESGQVDTTAWVTHRAPLEVVPERFSTWTEPEAGVIKAMIEC